MSPSDDRTTTLLWLRRDLRLADHPGWRAALSGGGPVVPVFLLDPVIEGSYGAAPKWRLGESLADLAERLSARGSRLILRRGKALDCLRDLIQETGARRVVWSRLYDPDSRSRDEKIRTALTDDGIEVETVNASLLFEPWTVETSSGGYYKVYSPFWRAVRDSVVHEPDAAPSDLAPPDSWPDSDALADWKLGHAMNRGAEVVAGYACVGEDRAAERLEQFAAERLAEYEDRDFPARHVTSNLSENLTYGEISPRQIWTRIERARRPAGETLAKAATKFLQELVWREFAYHLMWHSPRLITGTWREDWEDFPWRDDNEEAEAWRRARTGIDMVDAGLREMYVTGTMHNRVRMLVGSFLTKHLLTHWRVGERWFRDCLIDWDIANNSLGWQWVAGCGPDAAPYFRVFNPDLQADKFDTDETYRARFLEYVGEGSAEADAYYEAIPRSWTLSAGDGRPDPIIGLKEGRERALDAYKKHD